MSSEGSLILFAPGDDPKDCWDKMLQDDQIEATLFETRTRLIASLPVLSHGGAKGSANGAATDRMVPVTTRARLCRRGTTIICFKSGIQIIGLGRAGHHLPQFPALSSTATVPHGLPAATSR
jgi:hypothetical protein